MSDLYHGEYPVDMTPTEARAEVRHSIAEQHRLNAAIEGEQARLAAAVASAEVREALAKRLYWADVKHDDTEGRIPDEWCDGWWQTNAEMPLSGPPFLARWLALADAALPPTEAPDGLTPLDLRNAREWIVEGTEFHDGERCQTGWARSIERLLRALGIPPTEAPDDAGLVDAGRCNCSLPKGSNAEGDHHAMCFFKPDDAGRAGVEADHVPEARKMIKAAFLAGWDKCWCRDPEASCAADGGRAAAWNQYSLHAALDLPALAASTAGGGK